MIADDMFQIKNVISEREIDSLYKETLLNCRFTKISQWYTLGWVALILIDLMG